MAASARDQPRGSIEELNGIATWRLVTAAERAGVEHFVFFSALSASVHDRTRFLRSKALAEQAVVESGLRHTVFAPSLVLDARDRLSTLIERLAMLPAVPVPGRTQARFQPIWADDVAACVVAALERPADGDARFELAGPDTLTQADVADAILGAAGRSRRVVAVPEAVTRAGLRAVETLMKSKAPATWDEAEVLLVSMLSERGTADAESLGVTPRPVRAAA
jgi:NADH dehydrogenase